MSTLHLPRARQASLDRRLMWYDLISLTALPGALVSLAFPFYADRWPGTIDNEFAYCLVAGALWPLVVIEVARWRQVRLRVKSLSGAGA